ncbi:hypothetical protein [Mycobacterium genavense]|uniref:hypothetical protein n=1 Tax=Mycobacterium genavense TaxID=36812 RepID=UPI00046F436A|nr:hypothetical protein [Mycobacterium genavense]
MVAAAGRDPNEIAIQVALPTINFDEPHDVAWVDEYVGGWRKGEQRRSSPTSMPRAPRPPNAT